ILTLALGRHAASEDPLERAVALSGDYPAEYAEATAWLLINAFYGPMPADRAIARCKDAYEQAGANRTVQAFALVERAPLEAMRGEFDLARRLLREGRDLFD